MVLLSGYPLSHTTQAQNTTENAQTSNPTLRTILVTDDNDEVLANVSIKNVEQECLRPHQVMVLPPLMRNLVTKLAFTVWGLSKRNFNKRYF
jgi:hypothetical protein